jgi:hypothetical protein
MVWFVCQCPSQKRSRFSLLLQCHRRGRPAILRCLDDGKRRNFSRAKSVREEPCVPRAAWSALQLLSCDSATSQRTDRSWRSEIYCLPCSHMEEENALLARCPGKIWNTPIVSPWCHLPTVTTVVGTHIPSESAGDEVLDTAARDVRSIAMDIASGLYGVLHRVVQSIHRQQHRIKPVLFAIHGQ